jgi:tripartite-type tricarboxylate transporter receptor subunit TctC
MKALHLVMPLGKPSITWTTFDLLRPALQQEVKEEVVVETIAGHDGLDALHQMLQAAPDEPRLFGAALMATQYAWRIMKAEIHLEDLKPIAKVTNGFSMTLFGKRGGALKSWADLGTAKPLKLSSPQRHTAAYLAVLMMERKGGITPEVTIRDTIGEVIDDVTAGRSALGVANTTLVSMKLGELQPIVSFGAGRNAMLAGTPTFAEAMGNPKLAFTESIGVLGSPKLDPDLAAQLTQAFLAVGQDPDVLGRAEAANIPLALNGPEILTGTMARDSRILDRILG